MSETVWKFEHTVECDAPQEFAWEYWTNPAKWDDPPARFEFDGPFAAGTSIRTILPGQTLESVIREVKKPDTALIEMEFAGAYVRFRWKFEKLDAGRTKITQTMSLSGDRASGLVDQARTLEHSVPAGMTKIAERIEEGWKEINSC